MLINLYLSGSIKKKIDTVKSVLGKASKAKADVLVDDIDEIKFGHKKLLVRTTPGHTDGCITLVCHSAKAIFTGDALLIRGCGRTDFQQGNSYTLYDSIHQKVFTLPDDYLIFPGHDYTGQSCSSVGEEKRLNPRLSKPREEFKKIMDNLNLPHPAQIDRALPANLVCGIQE